MNIDTTDEIDDLEIITESLFALSPDDPFPNTVGTLLNHNTIIGWEELSTEAQNAVGLNTQQLNLLHLKKNTTIKSIQLVV